MKKILLHIYKPYSFLIAGLFLALSLSTAKAQVADYRNTKLDNIAMPGSYPEWIDMRDETNITSDEFISNYLDVLNLAPGSTMQLVRSDNDELGFTHHRYQQSISGIKVMGGEMIIHEHNGRIVSVNGKFMDAPALNNITVVNENTGLQTALREVNSTDYNWLNAGAEKALKEIKNDNNATFYPKGELVYAKVNSNIDNRSSYTLCWKFGINVNPASESKEIFVDAGTGVVVNSLPLAYDCSSGSGVTLFNGTQTIYTQLSGSSYRLYNDCQATKIHVRNGNGASSGGYIEYTDADNNWNTGANQKYQVQTAYGARQMYLYYKGTHSRNSYDNANGTLRCYLNPGFTGNAYWVSSLESAFFGGSSAGANPYTTLDVNGHELTHGVVQKTANLTYQGESGALNESFADIFGEMSESYALGNCDWIHRAEISGGNRSFINPNSKGQPDTYLGTNWASTSSSVDAGGVHTNSGVQNYWFYLLSQGGSGTNDIGKSFNVTGITRFTARLIAYRALTLYLTSSSQYIDARTASLHAAKDLYGACSNEVIQTGNAWHAVGVESLSPKYTKNVCGSYPASGTSVQAISTLTAASGCTVTITPSSSTVSFSASDRVILKPGFIAQAGSNFVAYINPCSISVYRTSGDEDMSDAEKGIAGNNVSDSNNVEISVAPNPFHSGFEISINSQQDENAKLVLYNASGVKIRELLNGGLVKGTNKLSFDGSDLAPGVYIIEINCADVKTVKRIIKI